MEIGVSTSCFYPLETEKAFLLLAEKGIKNTEIFFNSPCELEPDFVSELKKIKDTYGMTVKTIHPFTSASEPYFLFGSYERRVEDIIETYKRFFEVGQKLGAECVVIHGSRPQNHLTDELYCERFARLTEVGKKYGVLPAQENVVHCLSSSPDFLRNLKNYVGDNFRAILDIKQSVRAKTDVYKYIDVLGDSIVRIHMSDHTEKYDCLPPGEGNFDFVKFFSKLKEIGYKGDGVIELYSENYENNEQVFTAVEYLKKEIENGSKKFD